MNKGFHIVYNYELKIFDMFNSLVGEMIYQEFMDSPYSLLDYNIIVGNKPWIKILEPIVFDSEGNIITRNKGTKPFALCKTLKEFEDTLLKIYRTPLSDLNYYDTVVCICYEKCGSISHVNEIADMFYRMSYINVIEWEEIINQFDLYRKLQEG